MYNIKQKNMEVCNFCNRKFTENALTRHQSECKQIHSPASLTDSQRDGFIRKLLLQVSKMNVKMNEMQTEINYLKRKQKNQIATLLNKQQSEKPPVHILEWIKTIPVSQFHMEIVFRKSLEDGIKQVLMDALSAAKTIGVNVPFRAYTEKQKCIFVYLEKDDQTKWVICDIATFRKCCVYIASRFIESFVLWQATNMTTDQEQNMHFMKKVMDNTYSQQGHLSKMMELIYADIHVEMNMQEYI